ncbi:hypothetical protein HHL11_32255 [Ramlibacter sp. G-1-2-2]|uniref:Uncharacterized protein n=1 Tax=Ramlibacter agri TaxID=2728837 RepID=A0A848HIX9_9BURK|nr:hypothetical protein [Ramlibacter agri]NML48463.1 hypothetical protein [Ramlibacter agri]
MGKKEVREFEDELVGVQGGISLFRKGIDEFFLSHGFLIANDKLQAARKDLEALGLFERCSQALRRTEELVKLGPAHDQEAEMLILETARALMKASGTHDAMRKMLLQKPTASVEDYKPDPDAWAREDRQNK